MKVYVEVVDVSDIASHFRVRPRTVRWWVTKSKNLDWSHNPTPAPFGKIGGANVWTLEQLSSDWEIWYRNFLKDKARQSLKMSQEYEESRT